MKKMGILISGLVVLMASSLAVADEYKTVKFGDSRVVYNFEPMEEGVATLTVTSLLFENNDSFRGAKNSDQRRLSKLGELIYQCRLLLYKPDKDKNIIDSEVPILTSKNYSLFTGVDFDLETQESVSVQVQSLSVDGSSLFTPALKARLNDHEVQEYLGEGYDINLKQLSLNILKESDILYSADSLEINVRFPVFQLEKPVYKWTYDFRAKDFKKAVKHTNENCTSEKFMELVNSKSEF